MADVAVEQFKGAHPPECDCQRCTKAKAEAQRREIKRLGKAQQRAAAKDARKRKTAVFFASLPERVNRIWESATGFLTAFVSAYTIVAALVLVAIMTASLVTALRTGGHQWIVALCCVPALIVVAWFNDKLGGE